MECWGVFKPGALNYFTFFRPILSTLSVYRNPILTHLPLSGFLDSLLCVLIAPTPGLPFSLVIPGTLAVLSSILSGRGYFSTSSLFSLNSYSDYVGMNISLNNSSSLIFLNVYASPIRSSYFDSHCPSAEEYSSLSLSSAAALFTSLVLNAAKSSIPFGRIKRPPKAWWSAEVESAVNERRKAFAAAHRSDEDRQAYITASRRASSVIAKAKAEAWQTTCFSLSPKSNPKTVYSIFRCIAGSSSSSSSSTNFPNCSSPRKLASGLLRLREIPLFHFSVKDPG